MVQTPIPDTRTMIKGGQDRRHRRNAAWAGGGVAAVVLIAGGLYAAVQGSGDPDSGPDIAATPTSTPTPGGPSPWVGTDEPVDVEPGTYRLNVGLGGDGSPIAADLTLGSRGWLSTELPVFESGGPGKEYGAAGIQETVRLPGNADYCDTTGSDAGWAAASRTAADSSRALARQFTQLPSSTVVEPISSTQAFGHEALHLRLRVTDDCGEGVYVVFHGRGGQLPISYREVPEHDVVLDLLVVDLDGTPVVAYYWHVKGADPALVAEVTSVRDSIILVPSA